jgi:hypothetical protein
MIAFDKMNNHRLGGLIDAMAVVLDRQEGFWRMQYREREVWVMTDEAHDRMRAMTPVVRETDLSESDVQTVLAANFDRALDAKYALGQGCLWSVYMHPLGDLTEALFHNALDQVVMLAANYGTSFASTELVFQGDDAQ